MCLHTSVDIGGSISSFAIGFSPSPWPGTASSTLLQLSMPPGNLAAQEAGTLRIKPRVGIFFVDFSCGIFAVAFGCAVLLFMSDAQLELTLFGRSRVLVLYLLLGGFFLCISQMMRIWSVRAHVQDCCVFLVCSPKQARENLLL